MERSRRFPFLVVTALCLAALVCTLTAEVRAEADMKSIAGSVNAFSFDLYMKCRQPKDNMFLSPYSAAVALTMAYAGARGETESQMAKVLHFSPGQGTVHKALSELQRTILSSGGGDGPSLNIANALWGQEGSRIEEPFLSLLNRHHGSTLRTVDFKGNPRSAAAEINKWASHETSGRITNIVDPAALSPLTRLILANAIYFKGTWVRPFMERGTTDQDFTLADGSKQRVKMMAQGGVFFYTEYKDVQVLELPYKGEALSMVVFLPRRHDMLSWFEESLTVKKLLQTMAAVRPTEVKVFLPRFELTGSYLLNNALTALGMKDAFAIQKADLTGISKEPPGLFIEKVFHKTFAEVNEQGTEAAAVTQVEVRTKNNKASPPRVEFRADRPFMFLIRHRPSNCILFIGRVTNPTRS
jgi:serpin B